MTRPAIPPPLAVTISSRAISATEPTSPTPPVSLPRITIVTPSLNQGRFLEAAIRSIVAQAYPNLEYLVCDGGSTDESLDIIHHYESVITSWTFAADGGPAEAINTALAAATGEVIGWLNADDLHAPDTLWQIGRFFAENPAAQFAYGEGWYIDEAGKRIEPCRFVRRQFERRYLINKDPILQPAAFWRRSLWEKTGPLDSSLRWVFDWEWFIRAHQYASFHYLPEILAYYRVQPQALTRTGGLARQIEHGRVTRRYGAWWHPNHVVQQARRLDAAGQRWTNHWLRLPAAFIRLPLSLPRHAVEWLMRGMYMR